MKKISLSISHFDIVFSPRDWLHFGQPCPHKVWFGFTSHSYPQTLHLWVIGVFASIYLSTTSISGDIVNNSWTYSSWVFRNLLPIFIPLQFGQPLPLRDSLGVGYHLHPQILHICAILVRALTYSSAT